MLKKSSINTSLSSFDVVKQSIDLASEITGTKILRGHDFRDHMDNLTDKMWEIMYGGSNRPHINRHALMALRERLKIYNEQTGFDSLVAIAPTGFPDLIELMRIDYKNEKDSTAREEVLKLWLYEDEPPYRYTYTWKRQLELVKHELLFRPRFWEEDDYLCVGWNSSGIIRGKFYVERDHFDDHWNDGFYEFRDYCPNDHDPEFYHRRKLNPHLCYVSLKYANGEMQCSFRYDCQNENKKDMWPSLRARVDLILHDIKRSIRKFRRH
jgi:hypothetical protein